MPEAVKTNYQEETPETTRSPVEYHDKLYLHLKENFSKVKAYAIEMVKKIPVPDQCTIEGKWPELPKVKNFQVSLEKKQNSSNINCYTILNLLQNR